MFQQADDIQLFLVPFDLSESSSADSINAIGPMTSDHVFDLLKEMVSQQPDADDDIHDLCNAPSLQDIVAQGVEAFVQQFTSVITAAETNFGDVYGVGVSSFKEGQIEQAFSTFSIFFAQPETRAPALSALAACACYQKRYDRGFALAEQSIASKESHPRAHLIAGYCALQIGDRKSAKRHLALATRLARSDARYRDEQRCAQRELLLMQLAN